MRCLPTVSLCTSLLLSYLCCPSFALNSVKGSDQATIPGTVTPLNSGYVLTEGDEICNVLKYVPYIFELDYLTLANGLIQFQNELNKAMSNDMTSQNLDKVIVESVDMTTNSTTGVKRHRRQTSVEDFVRQHANAARTTTISSTTTTIPTTRPRRTTDTTTRPRVSSDINAEISGPNFLLLNALKAAAENLPITQVTSLLDSIGKHAPSLESMLKRFKTGLNITSKLTSSIKSVKRFTGRYWQRAAHLLKKWEEIKSTKELEVRNSTTDEKAKLKFGKNEEETDRLSLFQFLFNQADRTLHALAKASQQIRNKMWPLELIEVNTLNDIAREVSNQGYNVQMARLLAQVSTYPLTYPVTGTCDKEPCPLKLILFIPIQDEKDKYQEKTVHPLPTLHNGIMMKDWHKLKLPQEKFLYSTKKAIALKGHSTDCIPSLSEKDCALCMFEDTTRPASDPCLNAIAQNLEPWDLCPFEKIRNPTDTIVKIAERQWAYADDTPGHLTETCNQTSKTIELPTTGMLTLKPSCEYQISNNPISTEEIRADGITIQEITDYPSANSTKEVPSVENHLKENFLIYITTLGSVVLLLIIAWALCCYFQKRPLRTEGSRPMRRRRRPRSNTTDLTTILPLIPVNRVNRNNPIIL